MRSPRLNGSERARLDALIAYYDPILHRINARWAGIKRQNAALVQVLVVVMPLLVHAYSRILDGAIPWRGPLFGLILGSGFLLLAAYAVGLVVYFPGRIAECPFDDTAFQKLRTQPARAIKSHHLATVRRVLEENYRIVRDHWRRHLASLSCLIVGLLLVGILYLLRVM